MAIFFQRWGTISRSKGGNAVRHVAYVERADYICERTGERYCKKQNKADPKDTVILPTLTPAGEIKAIDLWQKVEKAEKRKDALVARTVILALPQETNERENKESVKEFQRYIVEKYGYGVSAVIHYDKGKNPHAHICMTTRKMDKKGTLAAKKDRIFNDNKTKHKAIMEARKVWEEIENESLATYGIRVSADRKKDPTFRLGIRYYIAKKNTENAESELHESATLAIKKQKLDASLKALMEEREKVRKELKKLELEEEDGQGRGEAVSVGNEKRNEDATQRPGHAQGGNPRGNGSNRESAKPAGSTTEPGRVASPSRTESQGGRDRSRSSKGRSKDRWQHGTSIRERLKALANRIDALRFERTMRLIKKPFATRLTLLANRIDGLRLERSYGHERRKRQEDKSEQQGSLAPERS